MPSETEYPGKSTRENILEAAIDLFSEKGFDAVSVREITRKVGIRESSLYNHFRSKDELLDVIFETFKTEFGKVILDEKMIQEDLSGMDPEIYLQHHLLTLRDRITPAMQRIWKIVYMEQFRDKRARDFVIREIIGRPAAFYAKVFTAMAEKGVIKPMDPQLLSDEYNYALLAFSLERMLLETDKEDVTPTIRRMFAHIKFFCEAVRK
ncbi:MAG: TetR/AcrR family transcriptional regulator [Firmicutes bacterium]|nr:TetR/AcrR family transcriptional regulator [Bacillota bacterium]